MLRKAAVLVQTALDKADEAQKEMESIPEAPTLQEQRTGAGACSCALQQHLASIMPNSAESHSAVELLMESLHGTEGGSWCRLGKDELPVKRPLQPMSGAPPSTMFPNFEHC